MWPFNRKPKMRVSKHFDATTFELRHLEPTGAEIKFVHPRLRYGTGTWNGYAALYCYEKNTPTLSICQPEYDPRLVGDSVPGWTWRGEDTLVEPFLLVGETKAVLLRAWNDWLSDGRPGWRFHRP